MLDEFITHNNGEKSYRVEIFKGENDKYHTVKVHKFHREIGDYELIKEWKNVQSYYTGEQNASVLFVAVDPKFEEEQGLRKIVHVYNDRVSQYNLSPLDTITQYHSDITDADVVLAYMITECGKVYVFDDHNLLIIKKPPQELSEIQKDFWGWYYANYSIQTFVKVLDVAETHSRD